MNHAWTATCPAGQIVRYWPRLWPAHRRDTRPPVSRHVRRRLSKNAAVETDGRTAPQLLGNRTYRLLGEHALNE
jgi:hypothetical protein